MSLSDLVTEKMTTAYVTLPLLLASSPALAANGNQNGFNYEQVFTAVTGGMIMGSLIDGVRQQRKGNRKEARLGYAVSGILTAAAASYILLFK